MPRRPRTLHEQNQLDARVLDPDPGSTQPPTNRKAKKRYANNAKKRERKR